MTIFHYKNARMHNIPTFVSKVDMDLLYAIEEWVIKSWQETAHQQRHRACKVLGDSRTQSELGSQILYKKCPSKSDHNDMKYNTNDTKYNI
jgi:transcriptional regulator with AAA-type ATPase domain